MTNREFYKEQILDVVCEGNAFAFDMKNNRVARCRDISSCFNCKFNNDGPFEDCRHKIKEWCNAEYIEPCPFEKDELVEVSNDGKSWSLGYFLHYRNGYYSTFVNGKKSTETQLTLDWKYCRKYGTLGGLIK